MRESFPLAQFTGFDSSEAMIAEATVRVPGATFAVFDVTQPLLLPADIVYARLLLGHLTDPHAALATWATVVAARERADRVRGTGALSQRQPVLPRVRGDRHGGGRGNRVDAVGLDCARRRPAGVAIESSIASIEHPVPAARAAAMFWRNAVQWRDRAPGKDVDALIERFQELELSGASEPVMWELRQVAFRKRHG